MSKSFDNEFEIIGSVLQSNCETRGVDAFCLAWIKYERQLRKLVANLIYQSSTLHREHQAALRNAFHSNRGISHTSARGAVWRLTGESVKALIGPRYPYLKNSIEKSFRARERIFHGQQSGDSLSREKLTGMINDIVEWCKTLSESATLRFGYDGFSGKTSLFKVKRPELTIKIDERIGDWKTFVASM